MRSFVIQKVREPFVTRDSPTRANKLGDYAANALFYFCFPQAPIVLVPGKNEPRTEDLVAASRPLHSFLIYVLLQKGKEKK